MLVGFLVMLLVLLFLLILLILLSFLILLAFFVLSSFRLLIFSLLLVEFFGLLGELFRLSSLIFELFDILGILLGFLVTRRFFILLFLSLCIHLSHNRGVCPVRVQSGELIRLNFVVIETDSVGLTLQHEGQDSRTKAQEAHHKIIFI